jgi:membrane-associated phospholipid phosphatase
MTRAQRGVLRGAALAVLALLIPLVILVSRQSSPLQRLDIRVHDALVLSPGFARNVTVAVTQLGAPLLLEALTVLAAIAFRRRSRLAVYVLTTVFGAELLSVGLKALIGRQRPCLAHLGCPATSSFPSGHAVGAAAFWVAAAVVMLPRLGRKAWWLLLVPPLVALTRLLLGVHYLSDVSAGLLVGGCWAAGCTAVFHAWRDERVPLEQGVG